MIQQRNPSHMTSDTTTPRFRPVHLPAASHRHTCFPPRFPPNRVAQRVGLKLDAIRPATQLACLPSSHRSISSPHLIGSCVSPVACPPYQPPAVAISLPPKRLIHLISPPHLIWFISRPAPLPALLPAGRPASPTCPPRSSHRLISLPVACQRSDICGSSISSISSAHHPHLIPTLHPMRRAASRRNGARDGQSTTRQGVPQRSIPQMPIHARRIAHTSRITHRHSHEHAHDKTPPICPLQRL